MTGRRVVRGREHEIATTGVGYDGPRASRTGDGETELEVPLETVCFIIMKAREFDARIR